MRSEESVGEHVTSINDQTNRMPATGWIIARLIPLQSQFGALASAYSESLFTLCSPSPQAASVSFARRESNLPPLSTLFWEEQGQPSFAGPTLVKEKCEVGHGHKRAQTNQDCPMVGFCLEDRTEKYQVTPGFGISCHLLGSIFWACFDERLRLGPTSQHPAEHSYGT